jgi:hypothetical protein
MHSTLASQGRHRAGAIAAGPRRYPTCPVIAARGTHHTISAGSRW